MNFYVQALPDGSWSDPQLNAGFDGSDIKDVNAAGWYLLNPVVGPEVGLNIERTVKLVLGADNVVTYVWSVAPKTGEALRDAARHQWLTHRSERDKALAASDYMMMSDYPISDERRAAWAKYRQALRDITQQLDPFAVLWPTDPQGRSLNAGVVRV